jgi:hypothetical protein
MHTDLSAGYGMRPENAIVDSFIACRYCILRQVLEFRRRALAVYSSGVGGTFEQLELAGLSNRICFIGFVIVVVVQKTVLDALHNDAAEASPSSLRVLG